MSIGPLSEWVLVGLVLADSIVYYFIDRNRAHISEEEWNQLKEKVNGTRANIDRG